MAIILCLDDILAEKRISVTALAQAVGITRVNMSLLKTGKVKAIKLSTLDRICEYLNCEPGDILKYSPSCHEEQECGSDICPDSQKLISDDQ